MKIIPKDFEGHCLVASENLAGSPFARSIILITHHEEAEGTLGVIFNRPTKRTLGDFLVNLPPPLSESSIYEGGPVQRETLTLMGLAFSGNQVVISSHLTPTQAGKFLKNGRTSAHLRAFIGYAGWAPQQLEGEIHRADWALVPFTPALLEPINGEKLWAWAREQATA